MPLNVRLAEAMGYFGVVIIDSSRVVSIALVIVVVGGYLELLVFKTLHHKMYVRTNGKQSKHLLAIFGL